MSLFPSILVPLDGSKSAAKSLGCAAWLCARLGARLHILAASLQSLPAQEELLRLHVDPVYWPLVELHQTPEPPEQAILTAIAKYDARLLVMSAHGEAAAQEAARAAPDAAPPLVGRVTQSVLERCRVPVLLLPPGYVEALPWTRLLVPVSGGAEPDEALYLAVRLASAIDLSVHVAHVADEAPKGEDIEARTRYSDSIHHEYRGQLEELVGRVLPPRECYRVRSIALGKGDVAEQLLKLIDKEQLSAIVVGWHGRFMIGRAQVLKRLIAAAHTPILLVRTGALPVSRLKVGEEFG